MGRAAEAMSEYFRCIHERDVNGIRNLFSEDATVTTYWGLVIRGNEAIGKWLSEHSFKTDPRLMKPSLEPPIEDGNRCVVEFDVETEDGPARLVNIFTADDEGRVSHFIAYRAFFDDPELEPGWVKRRAPSAATPTG